MDYPFIATATSLLPQTPSLNLGNHESVLHLCNSVILRMLHEWNQLYVIFEILFPLIIPLRPIQVVCVNSLFLFIAVYIEDVITQKM